MAVSFKRRDQSSAGRAVFTGPWSTGQRGSSKYAVIDFHAAYNLPDLRRARRTLELAAATASSR